MILIDSASLLIFMVPGVRALHLISIILSFSPSSSGGQICEIRLQRLSSSSVQRYHSDSASELRIVPKQNKKGFVMEMHSPNWNICNVGAVSLRSENFQPGFIYLTVLASISFELSAEFCAELNVLIYEGDHRQNNATLPKSTRIFSKILE